MDRNNLTMVNEGCTTRSPKESLPQHQSPPKGISVCDPQWRLACTYNCAGYHRGRGPTTPPWELMLHQSTSNHKPQCPPPDFVEIAQALHGEEPVESGPLPVITSIPTEDAVDPYKVMGTAVMAARLI